MWPINKTVAGKAGVVLSARPRPLLLHLLDLTPGLPRTRQTNNSWGWSVTQCNAVSAGTGCAGQSKPSDPVNSHCHQHSISANDAEHVSLRYSFDVSQSFSSESVFSQSFLNAGVFSSTTPYPDLVGGRPVSLLWFYLSPFKLTILVKYKTLGN